MSKINANIVILPPNNKNIFCMYKPVYVYCFNPFGENTYIIADETGECLIIDAGMSNFNEKQKLDLVISENNLRPVGLVTTHFHIDHIVGNGYIFEKYNIKTMCHADSKALMGVAPEHAVMFGFDLGQFVMPEKYVKDGDVIKYGNSEVEVLYTPGHAEGSICLVNRDKKFVITGDLLFKDSVGRTDLAGGDFDTLYKSIFDKIFTLPDDYIVYPGHGEATTGGYEKMNNPFLK